MSSEEPPVEKKPDDNLMGCIAGLCLFVGFIAGISLTWTAFNKLADREVWRVVASQTTQFKIASVTATNLEEVSIEVDTKEGRKTFMVYLGHTYFDRFLKLKPDDVISSRWSWEMPLAQKMNDRVYEHCQLYPWDITASGIKKPGAGGKNGL